MQSPCRGAERMYGYREAEALQMNVRDMVPDSKRAEALAYAECLIRGEPVTSFETQRVTQDGRVLDVWLTVTAYRDELGRPVGLATTERDISQRLQAENTIRKLNDELERQVTERSQELRLLAKTIANLGEGVLITSDHREWPGTNIVFVNEAMCRITGYTAEELIGHSPGILQGNLTERQTLDWVNAALSGGHSSRVEVVNYRKDGTPYDAEMFITPLFDEVGHQTNFVSIYRDISERNQAELALRKSEEQFRTVLNTASDAIITIDQHGIITHINLATSQIFGYTEQELLGQNVRILMPPPYCDEHDSYIARYLRTGEPRIIGSGRELIGRRKDGSVFPIGLAVNIVDHLGLFTGVIRDISAVKELQKQVLEIAAEEDRRIGHELHDNIQQQLTGLGLLAQSLAEAVSRESPQQANMATRLANGIKESAHQVHELSRGLVPVEIDAEGLRAALEDLTSQVHETHGVRCDFHCEQPLELTDNFVATHLYRIAQEAINNAVKHSRAECIEISLDASDRNIKLQVLDNGIGIDDTRGTSGMGLRIMEYRAGLLGGTLQIESGSERGTSVTCTIPRRESR